MSGNRRLLTDQVRDQMQSLVDSGTWPLGKKLPAEPDLCEEFGVSRATIREAVRSLAENGVLSRIHGSGTYVAFRPRVQHTLERNLSYSKLIEHAGFMVSRYVLSIDQGEANPEESEALQAPGAEVVRVERVRSADDTPVIYSIDAILADCLNSTDADTFDHSFYDLLENLGHPIANGEAKIAPVQANDHLADILKIDVGSPLLSIRQIDYSEAGRAVMFSQEWHAPSVIELSIRRRAS